MSTRSVSTKEVMAIGVAVQLVVLLSLLLVDHMEGVARNLAVALLLLDVLALILEKKVRFSANSVARILFYCLPLVLLIGYALVVNVLRQVGMHGL
jgi:hypothetical protein